MEYEVGEIVEVVNNLNGHGFAIGEYVRIRKLRYGCVESAEYLDGHDFWYLDEDDIAKLEKAK